MSTITIKDVTYSVLETMGEYELLVGPSIRDESIIGDVYLIRNTVTGVIETEDTLAPRAFGYLEQLSAEWDAQFQEKELAEEEAKGVIPVGSLRQGYEH